MKFTEFNNRTEVLKKFNLTFEQKNFVKQIKFDIEPHFEKRILKNFARPRVFNSEYSICEMIISPILVEISDANDLPLWSHFPLKSEKVDLSGTPDYLFALSEVGDEFYKKPVVCLGEAKKENFTEGWAQVSAEMVAAQKLNGYDDIPIYGLVSTGKTWDFAVLEGNHFILNEFQYNVPGQIDEVFGILNWIFSEGRKNADILEEREQKEKENK